MKIYLAGKISGDPNYKAKFQKAAQKIEQDTGQPVLNPALLPNGLSPEDYMQICFSEIGRADVVAFLPDWEDSEGAKLEHAYCRYVGKPILHLKESDL